RDAGELLDRRVLQRGRRRARVGVPLRAAEARPGEAVGERLRRRPGAPARRGRGRDFRVGGGRPASRADRRPPALGELLAGGGDRPVRPLLGDVLRPRPRAFLRTPDLWTRLLLRALPGVLEPRLFVV